MRSHNKRPQRVDVTKLGAPGNENNAQDGHGGGGGGGPGGQPPLKLPRTGNHRAHPGDPLDPNSSDHVVAMTQLKEQMASLQKQLSQKDGVILSKDKMVCAFKVLLV